MSPTANVTRGTCDPEDLEGGRLGTVCLPEKTSNLVGPGTSEPLASCELTLKSGDVAT